jgi:hypothetical protein
MLIKARPRMLLSDQPNLEVRLNGPMDENFVAGMFTQIRPVRIGELETRPKASKHYWLGGKFYFLSAKFYFNDVGYSPLKHFFV